MEQVVCATKVTHNRLTRPTRFAVILYTLYIEHEGMLDLLSSMKKHSLGKTTVSRIQADSSGEG